MPRIKVKKELCMSCLNCTLGCMAEHNTCSKSIWELKLSDKNNESRNHIDLSDEKIPTPVFCRHCEEPECVYTCMSGAMTKNYETGIVEYDEEKCASCFMCTLSCPYGVLKTDDREKSKVIKCDLCSNRSVPRCVESCPTGAIYIDEERR